MLLTLAEVLASNSSNCQAATGRGRRFEKGSTASDRMGKWDSFEQPLAYSNLAPSKRRGLMLHEA